MARGTLVLLALAALATILIGCAAESGGSSQQSAERQDSETAGLSKAEPPGQKAEGKGSSEQGAAKQLGHPALGSADAPVVLIEYGDYQ